jgi:hypothetical protein
MYTYLRLFLFCRISPPTLFLLKPFRAIHPSFHPNGQAAIDSQAASQAVRQQTGSLFLGANNPKCSLREGIYSPGRRKRATKKRRELRIGRKEGKKEGKRKNFNLC